LSKTQKHLISLSAFVAAVFAAGYLLRVYTGLHFDFSDLAALSLLFTLVSLVTIIIFMRGQTRAPESQTMHSLVAFSLKFLIELVIAFIWFFIAKKTGMQNVVLFFVLYLAFTMFSVLIILKTLKHNIL
jgi:hypothetical protein